MKYEDADFEEWVEDGVMYLSKLKQIQADQLLNKILDLADVCEDLEVMLKKINKKYFLGEASKKLTQLLVNNLQQIFAADSDIKPAKAIKIAFTIGLFQKYFPDMEKELMHAAKLCIPGNKR